MNHENPKHKQGDGAGFNRLRAAQSMRTNFTTLIRSLHPMGGVYIDQIREYAGQQVVFYRRTVEESEYACIAVFAAIKTGHRLENDIVVATS